MLSTTAFLAIAMQCAASIHPSTAFDVARVESGFNPYAIAEIVPKAGPSFGDQHIISHLPASRGDAEQILRRLTHQDRRYSVGLMQITSTNFRHYGVSHHRATLIPVPICPSSNTFSETATGAAAR